jgi:hypothetical protein
MNSKKLSASDRPATIEFVRCRIRLSARFSLPFKVGAFTLLLLSSTLLTTPALAQIFPKSQASPPVSSNKTISTLSLTQQPKAHNVKITSPTKDEKAPVGRDLLISGISAGNSNSTAINCLVSVIVNGIKPYHPANATGPSGFGDYSKWNFTLTPKYTTIKEGQNKITAKYSCANSPGSLSHNSVNVTGVATNNVKSTNPRLD